MPTIRDVARRSGYSITTISRVLNHTGYVSSKATKKIKTVMQEMDYVPNAIARDLSNGRTHKIGVILPQIKNPYFSKILEGIMEAAFSTDYSIMLLPSNYDEKKRALLFRTTASQGIRRPNHYFTWITAEKISCL